MVRVSNNTRGRCLWFFFGQLGASITHDRKRRLGAFPSMYICTPQGGQKHDAE